MKFAMITFGAAVGVVSAQCGLQADEPYPAGASICPTEDLADAAAPHMNTGNAVPACSALPCAAALLDDVGFTTTTGTFNTVTLPVGETIYGPFEAGFTGASSFENDILAGLGCSPASLGYIAGGIDTGTAEAMVAHQCSITLPRTDGTTYVSLLDECGGHTTMYHLHERLSCLYAETGVHSTKVGEGLDRKPLYGKWEDKSTDTLPELDACGGQFGYTPESPSKMVYHYHVQAGPPFTFGCYGPDKDTSGDEILVTLEKCRSLYAGCGDTTKRITVTTAAGSQEYDPYCPCYDANGSNVFSAPLKPWQTGSTAIKTCASCESGDAVPTAATPTSDACVHEDCKDWNCDKWCECFDDTKASVYTAKSCDSEDGDECDCPGWSPVAPVVVTGPVTCADDARIKVNHQYDNPGTETCDYVCPDDPCRFDMGPDGAQCIDSPTCGAAPHSYKLLQGTACTGRNELGNQPDINLAQAKRHCDGISSCVSFEMAQCDASGNCNFNFSTTCVESTSNGNYHNFDLYIKE